MADAMSYEFLIRRIYKVGRYGHGSADADLYRKMERAEQIFSMESTNIQNKLPRINSKSIDDLGYEYRAECSKIWMRLEEAVHEGITKYRSAFSEEDLKKIQDLIAEPNVVTKESIDQVIETVEKLFVKYKIYPG